MNNIDFSFFSEKGGTKHATLYLGNTSFTKLSLAAKSGDTSITIGDSDFANFGQLVLGGQVIRFAGRTGNVLTKWHPGNGARIDHEFVAGWNASAFPEL